MHGSSARTQTNAVIGDAVSSQEARKAFRGGEKRGGRSDTSMRKKKKGALLIV